MFQDACFSRKRLKDGTIKRILIEGAFPTLSGKYALTAEQKKSEDGREAKKKVHLDTLEERQRVRAAQVQEEANVQPTVLELGSFNNAKTMMAFLHKITLKNEEGVPLLLAEYKQSDFTAWGDNRVKWWQNTSRLEPLAWMWLRFDLRICSQHFEVGVLISF